MESVKIYEYVMEQFGKHDCPPYQEIAEGSKVSKRTIEKIARKEILDPGVSHVEKLAAFFQEREARATT